MQSQLSLTEDFSYLDQPDFRQRYTAENHRNEMRFYVGGIRCGKCVRRLEELPRSLPGLKDLRIEMGKNLAYADVDTDVLSFSGLAEKMREMGFRPVAIPSAHDEERALNNEDKSELIRLGIAAACAGNIMTFSFATYLGDTGAFHGVFTWLSFLLYLPVVSFVAWPFYRGAWSSLKQKQLSIDLPMAVASVAGFLFSTVQLLRGLDDVYFDSLSGFLFLILLSRWAQKRLQRRFLKPDEMSETLQLQRVRLQKSETDWSWVPLETVKIGDRILIYNSETLPVEAELVSDRARFSMAWLSGELKAKIFLKKSVVPAGARLAAGHASFVVKRLLPETAFGTILKQVQLFSLSKNRAVSLADKLAQVLLISVFALAAGFLSLYWSVSPEEAIRRSLALLILACPCAMAFGTPLALASGLRRATRKGLIVRNANVFENASKVQAIFFDKTGTLTDAELSLNGNPLLVPLPYQQIILSLENNSTHPIAFAFRKAFAVNENLPEIFRLTETPGEGVSGFADGGFYELKKDASSAATEVSCSLFENGHPIFHFTFCAALKPGCLETLQMLRAKGYRTLLVSGDNDDAVRKLGTELGFAPGEIYSDMSPQAKFQLVAGTEHAMMIGDGINDSLALMNAAVGVASSGGVESALRSSDVFLADAGLKPVADLMEIGTDVMALIRQNLLISLFYNLIGATLALLGFINPFVAAVLMPVSSGFILLSTWLRGRK